MDSLPPPIHQFPVEIIQKIFESVIYDHDPHLRSSYLHRLQASTALSHTSRFWRAIALETPYIWASVWLRLDKPKRYIEYYWTRTMERVKNTPIDAYIRLRWEANLDKLPHRFTEMKKVNKLLFVFDSTTQMKGIFTNNFPIPRCPIKKLSICIVDEEDEGRPHPPIELNQELSKWPPIDHVSLSGADCGIDIANGLVLEATSELVLRDQSEITLTRISQAFPNLRTLYLSNVDFVEPTTPATFNSVTKLIIGGISDQFLTFIRCPALTALYLRMWPPSGLVDFLKAHPAVTTLETSNLPFIPPTYGDFDELTRNFSGLLTTSDLVSSTAAVMDSSDADDVEPSENMNQLDAHCSSGIPEIAEIAPQLQTFRVWGNACEVFSELIGRNSSVTIFPNLVKLTVKEDWEPIPLIKFDEFVRRRCLPISHPDTKGTNVIQERIQYLTIVHSHPDDRMAPEWLASSYYECAKKTTYHNKVIKKERQTVTTLEWR